MNINILSRHLDIVGVEKFDTTEDGRWSQSTLEADELDSITLQFPGMGEQTCMNCWEEITDDGGGVWVNDDDSPLCPAAPADAEDAGHVPNDGDFEWANHAGISLDREGKEIIFHLSIGDPRGAYTFSARVVDGRIIIRTPYPGEAMPHEPLVELHPGTYEVTR